MTKFWWRWVLLILLVLTHFPCLGAPSQGEIEKVNRMLSGSNWKGAIPFLQGWIHQEYASPILFANLSLAYEKNGDIGQAMFWLKRAERKFPANTLIRARRLALEEKLPDRFAMPQTPNGPGAFLTHPWQFGTPAHGALLICPFIWGMVLLRLWKPAASRLQRFRIVLQWMSLVLALGFGVQTLRTIGHGLRREAVVRNSEVKLHQGPDQNSPVTRIIHAGLPLIIQGGAKPWLQVEMPDGTSGWVRDETLTSETTDKSGF